MMVRGSTFIPSLSTVRPSVTRDSKLLIERRRPVAVVQLERAAVVVQQESVTVVVTLAVERLVLGRELITNITEERQQEFYCSYLVAVRVIETQSARPSGSLSREESTMSSMSFTASSLSSESGLATAAPTREITSRNFILKLANDKLNFFQPGYHFDWKIAALYWCYWKSLNKTVPSEN